MIVAGLFLLAAITILFYILRQPVVKDVQTATLPMIPETSGPMVDVQRDTNLPAASKTTVGDLIEQPIDARWQTYEAINSEKTDVQQDVKLLSQLMLDYHGMLKRLPYGGNREFTSALLGKNRANERFIASNHPAVSKSGELVDRWGTAYFIHPIEQGLVEFRSGGPDRELWTDDDVVSTIPESAGKAVGR